MLKGTKVTCPWHGAVFDVTNGAVRVLLRRKTSSAIKSESRATTSKSNSRSRTSTIAKSAKIRVPTLTQIRVPKPRILPV